MSEPVKKSRRQRKIREIIPFLCPFCQNISAVEASGAGKKHACLFCGRRSLVILPQCPYRETAMQQKPTLCDSCKEVTPYGIIFHLQGFCRTNRERGGEKTHSRVKSAK